MSLITAETLPLGWLAAPFSLADAFGQPHELQQLRGQHATLLVFFSRGSAICRKIADELAAYARHYQVLGINVIAINPNDPQQDKQATPEQLIDTIRSYDFDFPLLRDPEQRVASEYQATCTPECYLFDAGLQLFYHGRFDQSERGWPASGVDLRAATVRLLRQDFSRSLPTPARGEPIRWHPRTRAPSLLQSISRFVFSF